MTPDWYMPLCAPRSPEVAGIKRANADTALVAFTIACRSGGGVVARVAWN